MNNITIYTRDNCMPCRATKKWVTQHIQNIPHTITIKNIDTDKEAHQEATKLGITTLPILHITNPEGETINAWGGHNPRLLQTLLQA